MPSEIMDQSGVAASSHLFEEIRFPSEKQVRKLKVIPDHLGGMDGKVVVPGGKLDTLSPVQKFSTIVGQPMPQSNTALSPELSIGGQGEDAISRAAWKPMNNDLKLWSDLCMKPASYSFDGKNNLTNVIQHESSLFSSSLSEVFCRKLQLSGNDTIRCQPVNSGLSNNEDSSCLEEIEGKTIGNLLPDEDDLFSGMTDVLGYNGQANTADDFEEFDLFSNGGGLELGEDRSSMIHGKYDIVGGVLRQAGTNGSVAGEHPSRTLFVRNINSNTEDSELKALFEQYGDMRTLYTACKHRGFVMITYYDLRAAHNAMRALQNKPMKHRNLDIHYSIPKDNPSGKDVNQGILVISNLDSSVSNNELHQIFGIYGEIKQIHETPDKLHIRIIEFYDSRAAEMASRSLNKTNIAGKQTKLEPGSNGGARQSLVQASNLEQDEQEPNNFRGFGGNLSSGKKGPGGLASSSMAIGSNQELHSAMRSPLMTSVQDAFSHQTSSLPNTLPSPLRMISASKQFGFCEPSNSLDEIKFGNQGIHNFQPHSLPEHHDGLAHGIPCNPPNAIASMSNLGFAATEGYASHVHGVNINRRPGDLKGVFGSFGSGSNPAHEQHYGWNNNGSYQQLSSSSMALRNSPSFVNGLHEHRFPQTSGLPRPHILSSSPVPHHIGSAPAVNPSLWERHAYSPGNSGLHLGSLGSAGFPASRQLHLMDIASQKMFSQTGGNCMDMAINAAQHSPHHTCHMFPGRNQISMPASIDSLRETARNFSHRRNDANSNNLDKRQYDLDVDRILHGEDSRTTLMIKNIPNKYTSKMLLAAIDEHCRGTYDFLYLPIDFKNKCNVGYAFINMIDPTQIIPFHQAFNGKKWEKFNSEKVATLAYARIQGKTALIAHFQNSSLMNEDKRCRPILFHTDGPNAGDPEPFPMGTNIRSRPGRNRMNGSDENLHGTPSVSATKDEAYDSASGSSKDSD